MHLNRVVKRDATLINFKYAQCRGAMGRVRPKYIKSLGDKLMEIYPDKFTDNFQHNKIAVSQLTEIPSKTVRNRVAGYITRMVKRKKMQEKTGAT